MNVTFEETVRVKTDETELGYMIIRKADYLPDVHGPILDELAEVVKEPEFVSGVADDIEAGELLNLAEMLYGVKLNPALTQPELLAEFRKMEQSASGK